MAPASSRAIRVFLVALALAAGPGCGGSPPRIGGEHGNDRCPARFPSSPEKAPPKGHCDLGSRCSIPDGFCECDGYHGGVPPKEGVDYSHWICGRTLSRHDGCPDPGRLQDGAPCSPDKKSCPAYEGMDCGRLFECRDGHWDGSRDTCAEIP